MVGVNAIFRHVWVLGSGGSVLFQRFWRSTFFANPFSLLIFNFWINHLKLSTFHTFVWKPYKMMHKSRVRDIFYNSKYSIQPALRFKNFFSWWNDGHLFVMIVFIYVEVSIKTMEISLFWKAFLFLPFSGFSGDICLNTMSTWLRVW